MITNLPADVVLSYPYRELERLIGKEKSAIVFLQFWCDLAFQSRVHGRAGVFDAKWIHQLEARLGEYGLASDVLVKSGFAKRLDDGSLFCPMFYRDNGHLDKSFIPPTQSWMEQWVKFQSELTEKAPKLTSKLPQSAYYLPRGEAIPDSIVCRAIVLIHTLDVILHSSSRNISKIDEGLVHGACAVVSKHSPATIAVILRRFLAVSRPRLNPQFPPSTEECIRNFEDLKVLACPDEGYAQWVRRMESKPDEETESATTAIQTIEAGLAEAIAGIPA